MKDHQTAQSSRWLPGSGEPAGPFSACSTIEALHSDLLEVRAGYLEEEARELETERRAREDELRAAAEGSRAVENRRRAERQRERVERAIARIEALMGGVAGTVLFSDDAVVAEPVSEETGGRRRFQRRPAMDGQIEVPYFFEPDLDPVTGEPMYAGRVVEEKKNNRQRVMSLARVYGPKLREMSIAKVIYETGETKAGSPASVRSSLGGLVKYGSDWERKNGWLHFMGEELRPDREKILELVQDRLAKQQLAN